MFMQKLGFTALTGILLTLAIPPLLFILSAAFNAAERPGMPYEFTFSNFENFITFYHVTLRLMRPFLMSTFLLLFVLKLEELAIPAVIGMPAKKHVLSSQIYLLMNEPPVDYGTAVVFALSLLLIVATGLVVYTSKACVNFTVM